MKRNVLLAMAMVLTIGANSQVSINAIDAKKHIGEVVSICGKIYSAKFLPSSKNQPTLLNLGGNYPNQLVTIAIFEGDRNKFPFKPEEYYPNTDVCVTGKLVEYRGMPEIIVQSPDQLKLQLGNTTASNSAVKSTPVKKKAEPVATGNEYDVTLTNDVHLRSGPGLEFDPITVLQAGSIVSVMKSNNGWSHVTVKKIVGTPGSTSTGFIKNNVLK
ncbi:SH3 domain-containing protein [Aridibaculum aurantiacum]|uniref:SH3 domain-containing protein n=1 Tax=Aridibaculum aurantiacum TaxID=2810307 RepID=UPI001A95DDE8|nr:SH3 domain-containing protein [Aridibaculum aurantiacum]